jgi:nitrate reductase gamma subunit
LKALAALFLLFFFGSIALIGAGASATSFFLVVVPYAAFGLFVAALVYRVMTWARSPVPFHIPTVAGQQRSLSWIRSSRLESPSSTTGLLGRMIMEILFFRSLWRNDRVELKGGGKLVFGSSRYLWAGAILFHWSLAVILFRHLRFFTDPVIVGVGTVQDLDGFFQIGPTSLYLSDVFVVVGLAYLALRRLISAQVKYISLIQDYFALFLLTALVLSGILMRFFIHPDLVGIKELMIGLITFHPVVPAGAGSWLVRIHLFLVSLLVAYFPFSKLMHAPGVFLSPTRNLKNNSREKRHVNPWNHPVRTHTYGEWEDEFRGAMVEAGLPVEKDG